MPNGKMMQMRSEIRKETVVGSAANQRENKIFGVLPTFRRPRLLEETLRRLIDQTRRLDHLVVIDNSPQKESEALVRQFERDGHSIEYLPSEENLGPAGGIALGMRRVLQLAEDSDWIVTLDDDDPLPYPTVLEDLERFAWVVVKRDPRTAVVGLVGSRFDWKRGEIIRVPDGELNGPVPVDWIGGNKVPFYRVAAIREVGPFCEKLFFGLDDWEYGLRLREAGYSIYACGELWYRGREKKGRLDLQLRPSTRLQALDWRRYYSLRNVIYILRSHGKYYAALRVTFVRGLGKPLFNFAQAPRLALDHLKLNWKACCDGWRGNMGRTLEPDGKPRQKL